MNIMNFRNRDFNRVGKSRYAGAFLVLFILGLFLSSGSLIADVDLSDVELFTDADFDIFDDTDSDAPKADKDTDAPKEDIETLKAKAEQGDAEAQCDLGLRYYSGDGVPKDKAEAINWYHKAAEQGYAKAQFNLALCYYNGEGVPEDKAEAVNWFRKAAEQGDAEAQFNLALCYYNGEGVPEDKAETVKWFRKAAEQGDAEAQYSLGLYYEDRATLHGYLPREAEEWYRKAAEQGHAEAQYRMGYLEFRYEEYYYGYNKPTEDALRWMHKAAEQGHVEAQYKLGRYYSKTRPANEEEAVKWFRKAAEQGHAEAQYNLGKCYDEGKGVDMDAIEAAKWIRKAAEQGCVSGVELDEIEKKCRLAEYDSEKKDIKTKTITVDDIEYTFCWCPPGEFTMGSPKSEERRFAIEKQHLVKLTKGFWLLESEVTQEMWETVMGTTAVDQGGNSGRMDIGPHYPMYCVNWDECQEFCRRLSKQSGEQITLPTEAQWEYACRAGTDTPFGGTNDIASMGNCESGLNVLLDIHPINLKVKTKRPNHWGLYDMHGNVWEWCSDWNDVYPSSPQTDPKGPKEGTERIIRGGSHLTRSQYCRSACRGSLSPTFRGEGLGFRIALIPED